MLNQCRKITQVCDGHVGTVGSALATALHMDRRLCPLPVCQDESKTQRCAVRATPSAHIPSVTLGTSRNILCHTVFLFFFCHSEGPAFCDSYWCQLASNRLGLRAVTQHPRKGEKFTLYSTFQQVSPSRKLNLIVWKRSLICLGLVTTPTAKGWLRLMSVF